MAEIIEGKISAEGFRFAIIVSRFNDFISSKLVEGAMDALKRHGGNEDQVSLIKVPGAFEIPLAAKKLAESGKFNAIICLGAVIRGSTPHFDYVAAEVSKGIAQVALESKIPVTFGVLTTDNLEQAIERAGSKLGNKGWDAAIAAMEMVNLFKQIKEVAVPKGRLRRSPDQRSRLLHGTERRSLVLCTRLIPRAWRETESPKKPRPPVGASS